MCPCAVFLLGQSRAFSLQALHSSDLAQGQASGHLLFPPDQLWFKATGQCKLCSPGPARLFLLLLFLFQECVSSSLKPPMPPTEATSLSKGFSPSPGPRWRDPPPHSGPDVCLMRDTVQFFAFTQSWAWRPKTVHLINGLVLSSLHRWNPGSRL